MRRPRPYILLALVGGLFAAGFYARQELGIEFSRESMEQVVSSLGWKAPAFFVLLVTFRQFVAIPSAVALSIGGVIFGAASGTALGALGIVLSAAFGYSVARGAGEDWLQARLGSRAVDFRNRARAAGPFFVGIATAHPAGPMTAFHWGAGLAAVPALGFLVAVLVAAPIRASMYAFFGSTLFEPGTPRFWIASAALALATLVPLAHTKTRNRLLGAFRLPPAQSEEVQAE